MRTYKHKYKQVTVRLIESINWAAEINLDFLIRSDPVGILYLINVTVISVTSQCGTRLNIFIVGSSDGGLWECDTMLDCWSVEIIVTWLLYVCVLKTCNCIQEWVLSTKCVDKQYHLSTYVVSIRNQIYLLLFGP